MGESQHRPHRSLTQGSPTPHVHPRIEGKKALEEWPEVRAPPRTLARTGRPWRSCRVCPSWPHPRPAHGVAPITAGCQDPDPQDAELKRCHHRTSSRFSHEGGFKTSLEIPDIKHHVTVQCLRDPCLPPGDPQALHARELSSRHMTLDLCPHLSRQASGARAGSGRHVWLTSGHMPLCPLVQWALFFTPAMRVPSRGSYVEQVMAVKGGRLCQETLEALALRPAACSVSSPAMKAVRSALRLCLDP